MPPTVSVCIPVYNCESYLSKAISSVLQQTFTDFELLILDNCSTDRTPAIIREFADRRIRVITHARNIGAEENWNAALRESKGQYIKLLCADDFLYPACLGKQVAVLNDPAYAGVSMVTACRDIVTPDEKRIMTRGLPGGTRTLTGREACRISFAGGTNLFGESLCVMFRASLLEKVGGFDIAIPYVIDFEFWCRLLEQGDLYFIAEPLGAFRVALNSWSESIANRQATEFCRFMEAYSSKTALLSPAEIQVNKTRVYANATVRRVIYWLLSLTKR